MQPDLCSLYKPDEAVDGTSYNGPVTGSDYGNTIETGSTEIWYTGTSSTTVTYRGETLTLDPIASVAANPAVRDVNDCATWVEGKNFKFEDLVCELGTIYECLDTTGLSCG
jgi:hypothetical protein